VSRSSMASTRSQTFCIWVSKRTILASSVTMGLTTRP
jgi:hypothetical protein